MSCCLGNDQITKIVFAILNFKKLRLLKINIGLNLFDFNFVKNALNVIGNFGINDLRIDKNSQRTMNAETVKITEKDEF